MMIFPSLSFYSVLKNKRLQTQSTLHRRWSNSKHKSRSKNNWTERPQLIQPSPAKSIRNRLVDFSCLLSIVNITFSLGRKTMPTLASSAKQLSISKASRNEDIPTIMIPLSAPQVRKWCKSSQTPVLTLVCPIDDWRGLFFIAYVFRRQRLPRDRTTSVYQRLRGLLSLTSISAAGRGYVPSKGTAVRDYGLHLFRS